MKIYVTRHGQIEVPEIYYNGDKEIRLTALGRQQATLLGKHMRELEFRGKILSSPLLRAMETAELVADETGSEIVPVPWLHEIFWNQEKLDTYRGSTLEELRGYCRHVSVDASLPYPWWTRTAEDEQMVFARVAAGLEEYPGREKEDVLLVGHGASGGAVHDYFHLPKGNMLWNCCLGMYDSENPEQSYGNDVSHLPPEMVSSNKVMALQMEKEIAVK